MAHTFDGRLRLVRGLFWVFVLSCEVYVVRIGCNVDIKRESSAYDDVDQKIPEPSACGQPRVTGLSILASLADRVAVRSARKLKTIEHR